MKKTLRSIALLLSLIMIIGSFAACGDGAADTTTGASGETTADSGETTTAEPQTLSADSNVLVVGTNPEFPPFEYINDDQEMDGFDIALINAMAEKMGKTVRMESMDFKSLITSIGRRIDIAIAGMTVKEERLETVDFTDSYFTAVQYVLVAKDNEDIKTIEDLDGKKIGVQEGTTGDFIASDDIKDAEVSRFSKAVTAVTDLANGRLDAVIIDKNPAIEFEKTNGKIKIIGTDFFEDEHYAIALPKGQPELLAALNSALAEVKADGTFDELLEKYIVGDSE